MKKLSIFLLFISFIFSISNIFTVYAQTTYYVTTDGSDDDGTTGTSWVSPFATLQKALSTATSGDKIFVKKGTYTITTSIVMKEGVEIYGSFAGTETTLTERPPFDPTATDNSTLDGNNNKLPIVRNYASGLTNAAVLDGFVLINGNSPSDGGGVYNRDASPTLRNLVISNNTASSRGGGMYNYLSSPTLNNVSFNSNTAASGGGMYSYQGSPTLNNVSFNSNTATSGGGTYNYRSSPIFNNVNFSSNTGRTGGGMFNSSNSNPSLSNVTFSSNTATSSGGGMYNTSNCKPTLSDVTFSSNTATSGGGMYNVISNPLLTNVVFSGNQTTGSSSSQGGGMANSNNSLPVLTNVLFSGNKTTTDGGAIYNNNGSSPILTNVTISGNYAAGMGGAIANGNSGTNTVALRNSIVLGNTAGTDSHSGIYNDTRNDQNSVVITYSLVEGHTVDASNNPDNNISASGLTASNVFVNPVAATSTSATNGGNYNLKAPAINAGSSSYYATDQTPNLSDITTDLNGVGRFNYNIDLGAYENQGTIYFVSDISDNNTSYDGLSWEKPFATLQKAINAASSGDKIFVKKGTYTLTTTIEMKEGVEIYGGFAGTETSVARRPPFNPAATDNSTLDGNNSQRIIQTNGLTNAAILDGFVLTNANSSGDGGGIYNFNSSPTLRNLAIKGNTSGARGGGMSNFGSSPALSNVTFSNNTANDGGGMYNNNSSPTLSNVSFNSNTALTGGGMYNLVGSSPSLSNVTFSDNTASGNSGGGMYNSNDSSPSLSNASFSGNTARYYGGGMYNYLSSPSLSQVSFNGNNAGNNGGGMYNIVNSNAQLTNVSFNGNTASSDGGAMYISSSNPVLTNVLFSGNKTTANGGAIYNQRDSSPVLTNVTISGNYAADRGGAIANELNGNNVSIRNSIILGNNNTNGNAIDNNNTSSNFAIYYSLIEGHTVDASNNPNKNIDASGLTASEVFVNPVAATSTSTATGNYQLKPEAGNPAINVGSSSYYATEQTPNLSNVTTDLNNANRFKNLVDIGAYENQIATVTYYVTTNGSDDDGTAGTSWVSPFATLQKALSAATSGDKIFVKKGTYTLTTSIVMKEGVEIYGSFAGTETSLDQRSSFDPAAADNSTLDGNNSLRVIYNNDNGLTNAAVLDGFVLTNAKASGDGGGIYNRNAAPTLRNLMISNNTASSRGGGMYNLSDSSPTSPTINNVSFNSNTASNGGGMCNYRSSPTLNNVSFNSNTATSTGGGMYNISNSNPSLSNVSFSSNTATSSGGGMYNTSNCKPTLSDVTFSSNTATSGGGMYNVISNPLLTNVVFSGNQTTGSSSSQGGGMVNFNNSLPVLTNVLFSGNKTTTDGGAIYNNNGSSPILTNVTISGNYAAGMGGAIANGKSGTNTVALRNSIVLGNTAGTDSNSGIYNDTRNDQNSVVITYSLVEGHTVDASNNPDNNISASGLTASDVFVNPVAATSTSATTDGNYNLKPAAPAINAGSSSYYATDQTPNLSDITIDLNNANRFKNHIDIGAYENQSNTYFVKIVLHDDFDGLSWEKAFPSLQEAINAASSGDKIFVKKGTYTLASSIVMKEGVEIYGSFAGTETSLDQRPPFDPAATDNSTLDGNNSLRIIYNNDNGLTKAAVLDGFVLTKGYDFSGGGMHNRNVSPTLRNLVISNNASGFGEGGGMYNEQSSPSLSNVVFTENDSSSDGGGMYNYNSSPTLNNVSFNGNSSALGGGMSNYNSSPTLNNVSFSSNLVRYGNGGGGGGMYNSSSSPLLTNVEFSGNQTIMSNGKFNGGGGMYNTNNSNPVLTNVLFSGNKTDIGGAMYNQRSSSPILTNVTISGNYATELAGGIANGSEGANIVTIRNSILLGNAAHEGNGIYNYRSNDQNVVVVHYSLVQDLTVDADNNPNNNISASGLTASDVFVNPVAATDAGPAAGGNYNLKAAAPAINAGSSSYYATEQTPNLSDITTDLNGVGRFNDNIDLGPYENYQTLPVTLLAFKGKTSPQGNQLNWQTASESAFKGFELQRAANDGTFKPLTFVTAKGGGTYQYTDRTPLSGNNYYRLKMIDDDGSFKYADNIVHLSFSLGNSEWLAYPVPFNEQITLQNAQGKLTVVNITGQAVYRSNIDSAQPTAINLGALPAGIYILQLQKEDGKLMRKKVLKKE